MEGKLDALIHEGGNFYNIVSRPEQKLTFCRIEPQPGATAAHFSGAGSVDAE